MKMPLNCVSKFFSSSCRLKALQQQKFPESKLKAEGKKSPGKKPSVVAQNGSGKQANSKRVVDDDDEDDDEEEDEEEEEEDEEEEEEEEEEEDDDEDGRDEDEDEDDEEESDDEVGWVQCERIVSTLTQLHLCILSLIRMQQNQKQWKNLRNKLRNSNGYV